MDGTVGQINVGSRKRSRRDILKEEKKRTKRSDEEYQIQCGMCSALFPDKRAFVEHSTQLIDNMYQCCKCLKKFKEVGPLYQHFDTHTPVDDQQETISLNYEDSEEVVVEAAGNGTNELMYVLDGNDDIDCETEVVVAGDQPTVGSVVGKSIRETLKIVNLEHGYVVNSVHIFQHKFNLVLPSEDRYKCSVCSAAFPDVIKLTSHTLLGHKTNPVTADKHNLNNNEDTEEDISCELCFDIFDSKTELEKHMEFHNELANASNVTTENTIIRLSFSDDEEI
ncbi:unnamed protein product [Diabrotica balteata]|uniref:C2H2-type domain-containing protein n=1 Tax=Diabrotica balteata TaxID=107213 RepID=A0A9N9XKN4_DIABA|nr:unnamed protein product [Diabrotica balteata]